jgi:hypothetical protein
MLKQTSTSVAPLNFETKGYDVFSLTSAQHDMLLTEVYSVIVQRLRLVGHEINTLCSTRLNEALNNIENKQWTDAFGVVSYRMLGGPTARKVMEAICDGLTKSGFPRDLHMHNVTDQDLINNRLLTPEDFSFYCRIVRPNTPSDVGYAHRDCDFWLHDVTPLPKQYEKKGRLKIWIPLFGCTTENSLHVIPGSHLHEVPVSYVKRSGNLKPKVNDTYMQQNKSRWFSPISKDGQFIVFHDRLVHWGPENIDSPLVRISAECTLLYTDVSDRTFDYSR